MSDLSRAAEAMGIPEPLAERSARARAEASGRSYEEILAAWAGGQSVAEAPAPPEPEAAEPQEEPDTAETPAGEPATGPAPTPAAPPASAAEEPAAAIQRPSGPSRPPVLEAPPDHPLVTVAGGILVVAVVVLLGFVFPSLPAETEEIRSSVIAFSELGEQGRGVYLSAGCASCHTQSVRAVVADVGVGPVTLSDTNQVPGFRRIGPDLSNVGGRLSEQQIRSVLVGGSHPAMPLSDSAVDALVAYLVESAYLQEGGD